MFVIVDKRNGGTLYPEPMLAAMGAADIVLTIESDDHVNVVVAPDAPYTSLVQAFLFYAQTEADESAERAASHIEQRKGNPRTEADNHLALQRATEVWRTQ